MSNVPEHLTRDFASLFAGRPDVVGTDSGGCVRVDPWDWPTLWRVHLQREDPIGVYPYLDDKTAAWGCVDIDVDVIEHARNLEQAFTAFNVQSYVERSRSKGYHVWVLTPYERLPVEIMRPALQAACQLVGAPDKEVNPKQLELPEGSVGNYVRLPYPMAHRTTLRQVVLDADGNWLTLPQFVSHALRHTADQSPGLVKLSELYQPPPKPELPKLDTEHLYGDPHRRMSPLAWTIYDKGPFPGATRGATLWHFINELVEQRKHTSQEIIELAVEWDVKWGSKFMSRPNGRSQIERQVERAFR